MLSFTFINVFSVLMWWEILYSIGLQRLKPVHTAYGAICMHIRKLLMHWHNLAENWPWTREVNGRDRDETERLTIFLETRPRRDVGTSRDRLETETSRPRPQHWLDLPAYTISTTLSGVNHSYGSRYKLSPTYGSAPALTSLPPPRVCLLAADSEWWPKLTKQLFGIKQLICDTTKSASIGNTLLIVWFRVYFLYSFHKRKYVWLILRDFFLQQILCWAAEPRWAWQD